MRSLALCLFVFSSFVLSFAQHQTTYSNLDDQTATDSGPGTPGWGGCSGCAGGENSTIDISTSLVGWPSRDGQSRQFFINAQLPYTNALWWYKLGIASPATRFKLDLRFYIDENAATNVQAFEFDTFQNISGQQQYTFGLQCNVANGTWDVWNGTGAWVPTQVACNGFSPQRWHHLTVQYHRSADLNMHYDSLALDGVSVSLGYIQPSIPLPAGWTGNLGVQFQLDIGGNGGQATMWVDNVSLTASR
ncbi:MAG TPA: hypothetical protein VMU24_02535 [Candidatus Acidoferrales bacterium]|nr:hypothetical protein [Candidatus Acidoferrales bacterium]